MSALPKQAEAIRAAVVAVLMAATLTGLPACAGEPTEVVWPDDPTEPPRGVGPFREASPTDAASNDLLLLVDAYREVEVESYSNPQPPHVARPILADYLADPLLSETLVVLNDMYAAGIAFEGRPTWEPVIADLRLDETPPTATIHDCVDASSWRSVFRETGESVPGDSRPDQYVTRFESKLHPGGWLLYRAEIEEGAQC